MNIVQLVIHPDAMKHFNVEGETLVSLCEKQIHLTKMPATPKFAKPHISATLTDDDIADIEIAIADSIGNEYGRLFINDGEKIGLVNEGYKRLIKLSEAIQKALTPKSIISRKAIETEIFVWVKERYSKNMPTLIEFIIPRLEEKTTDLEIWIPIGQLQIQEEVMIGRIFLKPINDEVINYWQNSFLRGEDNVGKAKYFEDRLRRPLLGWTASVFHVLAEPIAAQEMALYETERALSMFRLFTPSAITPKLNSYIAIMGSENIETITTIGFEKGELISITKEKSDTLQRPIAIESSLIARARQSGLDIISSLLCKAHLTKFEENILDSLMLYSNATKEKDLASKIIYILAALENMFLKNETESIQQNLAERIAIFSGKNLEERKKIIKNIRTIYSLRSAFLHHAHSIHDYDELEKFMQISYIVLISLVPLHAKYLSNQELIAEIDDVKLS